MENLSDTITTFVSKNMIRIVIFLFTMMVGMLVALNGAHAATRTLVPTPSPTAAPATSPVPIVTGTVSDVSSTNVSIKSDSGQTTTLTFSPNVRVEAPGITSIKGKPTVKNIAVNDKIAAVTPDQTTTAVVVIAGKNGATLPEHQSFFGIVSSRDATTSGTILSLKAPNEDQFAKAQVSSQTQITAQGISKPTVDDIKAGDDVIVVGPKNNLDLILADKLFLIPGKARGILDHLMNSLNPSASGSALSIPVGSPSTGKAKVTTTP